jgi:DNA-binding GntR family transcriptional regulator
MTAAPQMDPGAEPAAGAVATALGAIRDLIRRRELLPGEPVRQQDMAKRLGMSRVPVREALKALQTEGIVRHSPNQGYFVAKFSSAELDQIYLMRRVLETALLQHLDWPDEEVLAAISEINDGLARAAHSGEVALVVQLNREFHEAVFSLSPLKTVHREVARLWEMSDSYRALYLYGPARERIAAEHQAMLDALAARDLDALIAATDRHRGVAQEEVAAMLGGRSVSDTTGEVR